jgi:hypothetical protein
MHNFEINKSGKYHLLKKEQAYNLIYKLNKMIRRMYCNFDYKCYMLYILLLHILVNNNFHIIHIKQDFQEFQLNNVRLFTLKLMDNKIEPQVTNGLKT